MDSINRIPAFIPEPNFIIYASIMATLVSGFMVIDVMWFLGTVMPRSRCKEPYGLQERIPRSLAADNLENRYIPDRATNQLLCREFEPAHAFSYPDLSSLALESSASREHGDKKGYQLKGYFGVPARPPSGGYIAGETWSRHDKKVRIPERLGPFKLRAGGPPLRGMNPSRPTLLFRRSQKA
jgi:hypothetical protein